VLNDAGGENAWAEETRRVHKAPAEQEVTQRKLFIGSRCFENNFQKNIEVASLFSLSIGSRCFENNFQKNIEVASLFSIGKQKNLENTTQANK